MEREQLLAGISGTDRRDIEEIARERSVLSERVVSDVDIGAALTPGRQP